MLGFTQVSSPLPQVEATGRFTQSFRYDVAFTRNRGLVSSAEQEVLRSKKVAIAGLGGVGGAHLTTLVRLGVGSFGIADPDSFDLVNFNRQQGANIETVGRNKAAVMAEQARSINPELRIEAHQDYINESNVDEFLDGADIFIDGIDFFAIETRRLIFNEARRRKIWSLTAGPVGFSTAFLAFSPDGISFDEYFDIKDGMSQTDQLIAFLTGLAPHPTHLGYVDVSEFNPMERRGPSVGLACDLCAGVLSAQALRLLLGRGGVRPAPHYLQFDAYRTILRKGRLWMGNRNPLQKLKRAWIRKRMDDLGWEAM